MIDDVDDAFDIDTDAERDEESDTQRAIRTRLYEVGNLVCATEGSEASLTLYAMVLDDQLRTYDLEHLLSIFDNLHDLNTIFESNPLLDHAYFKCTLLMYQQLLDQAKGEVRAKQNQVDTGITDVFYELLTNLHLTEQIEEWNRIQKYLFAYMGEGQDARIRISEYAEMLSFMSINMDVRKHGQMLSVGRDLLTAFPNNPYVVSGYGYVLYSGMNFLEEERSDRYRRELVRLICAHPDNQEILTMYIEELLASREQTNILGLLERKQEIEMYLQAFLGSEERLTYEYALLLKAICEKQDIAVAVQTMQALDRLLQKHPGDKDIEKVYESVLKILAERKD